MQLKTINRRVVWVALVSGLMFVSLAIVMPSLAASDPVSSFVRAVFSLNAAETDGTGRNETTVRAVNETEQPSESLSPAATITSN